MNVLIEFKKDHATKKKGDVWECDSQHAARLINQGIAKKRERKPAVKKTVKKAE
jgi:hypothetical protein